jgi:hypothetical protein
VAKKGKPFFVKPESAAFARSMAPFLVAIGNLQDETIKLELSQLLGAESPRFGNVQRAVDKLAEVIGENQMVSDVTARREVLQAADRFRAAGLARPGLVPEVAQGGLPVVSFPQAVGDILARDPRLAMSGAEVSAAYGSSHTFAVAHATSLKVTERVQKSIARFMDAGTATDKIHTGIREIAKQAGEDMTDWSHSYAETVWRTNMSTAYSAGRFRQMADPAVAYAIGALMFDGPTDVATKHGFGSSRANHVAAVGLIGAADDPGWQIIAPPLGYNCRHSLSFISWGECETRGFVLPDGSIRRMKIPSDAFPDKGFRVGGRPDQLIYSGAL